MLEHLRASNHNSKVVPSMADMSSIALSGGAQGAVCTRCNEPKPLSEFYWDKSRGRHRPACIACVKAQNYRLIRNRTPAQKAAYRRRYGEVAPDVPYVPRAIQSEIAALRRIGQHYRTAPYRARVAQLRLERAEREKAFVAGTDAWTQTASDEQIERLASVAALKSIPRSGETVLLRLSGIYAVGPYEHAIVDVEDYDYLSRYAWRAKPNGSGSGVYAIRSTRRPDGTWPSIRMHREVLRIGGDEGLDVDHIDGNPLNNSLSNLRLVTRSQNARNSKAAREAVPSSVLCLPPPC